MKRIIGVLVLALQGAVVAQPVNINVHVELPPSSNPALPPGVYESGETILMHVRLNASADISGPGNDILFGQIELNTAPAIMEEHPDDPGFPFVQPTLGPPDSPNLPYGTLVAAIAIPGQNPLQHVDVIMSAPFVAFSLDTDVGRNAFDVPVILPTAPGGYTIDAMIDALGPCPDPDWSSTIFQSEDGQVFYNNCDADPDHGVVQVSGSYSVIPEPATVGLILATLAAAARGRLLVR